MVESEVVKAKRHSESTQKIADLDEQPSAKAVDQVLVEGDVTGRASWMVDSTANHLATR